MPDTPREIHLANLSFLSVSPLPGSAGLDSEVSAALGSAHSQTTRRVTDSACLLECVCTRV